MSLLQSASARIRPLMGSGIAAGNQDQLTYSPGALGLSSRNHAAAIYGGIPARRRFLLYSSDSWAPKDAGDARKIGAPAVPAKALQWQRPGRTFAEDCHLLACIARSVLAD